MKSTASNASDTASNISILQNTSNNLSTLGTKTNAVDKKAPKKTSKGSISNLAQKVKYNIFILKKINIIFKLFLIARGF